MNKTYEELNSLIKCEYDTILKKEKDKDSATRDAIALVMENIEYFKFITDNLVSYKKYEFVMSYLKSNFEEFDEDKVTMFLFKNGFLSKKHINNITNVFNLVLFIVMYGISFKLFYSFELCTIYLNLFVSFIIASLISTLISNIIIEFIFNNVFLRAKRK